MIKGHNLEFDHILLQLQSKTALSLTWPPSFKSFQITSSFFSLWSHRTQDFKNVPASGLRLSYYSLRQTRVWDVYVDFPRYASKPFWLF